MLSEERKKLLTQIKKQSAAHGAKKRPGNPTARPLLYTDYWELAQVMRSGISSAV